MKELTLKPQFQYMDDGTKVLDYQKEDVLKIAAVFAEKGFVVSEINALLAWELYSETLFASWLNVGYDDDYIYDSIKEFLELK